VACLNGALPTRLCPPRRPFVASDAAAVDKAAVGATGVINIACGTGLPTRR
jgi:hypothetical protein